VFKRERSHWLQTRYSGEPQLSGKNDRCVGLAHFSCFFLSFEDEELKCEQGKGVYLSSAATILFFIAACLNCGAPRADPFCYNFGKEHKPATKTPETSGQTIVLQPVIIHSPAPDTNGSNKKKKKKKPKPKKSNDDDDDDKQY
jgi:hypothetical protein